MKEKYKKIISIAIIILLLPYVLTVFIKGEGAIPVYSNIVEEEVYVEVADEIIQITWEEYLVGILAREIPEEYSLEAMKAQAVIIRTRLETERAGDSDYIFQETYYTGENIQTKWGNQSSVEIYSQLVEAVEETWGEVLMYQDTYAKVPYHMLNTGMTRNGSDVFGTEEYAYLQSVSCPLDIEAEQEITMFTISYEEIQEVFELNLDTPLLYEEIEILSTDEAGYVLSISVQGNVINGETFRTELALKSSAFSFQEDEGDLKITTEGIGHGLGMSQNTAHYMGLEGKTYEEILAYFYAGTELAENEIKK